MAQFYARDRGYGDYHLELPIEKMAQKELKKGSDKIEQIKVTASLAKQQKAAYISALNKKYKIQKENLDENFRLTQANYKLIHDREQLNAQREFENLQRSRGNPGPKQAQGFGSLMEMAPALAQMVGEYVEKEKIHRQKTISNQVLEIGAPGSQVARWEKDKAIIAGNTFEAQMYAKAESAKLGVEVTPEQMLAIVELWGQRNITAMTALAHNSAPRYASFLLSNDDTEIVLGDGITKTWGQIRNENNPAEFESGIVQMRGHFMEKHQISIMDTVPGVLDSIGKHVRQVESQERGRFHNAVRQKKSDIYDQHEDTEFYNSLYEGSTSLLNLENKRAFLLAGPDGKPNYNLAFDEMQTRFTEGIQNGTVTSEQIQGYLELKRRQPQGWAPWKEAMTSKLLDEARNAEVSRLQSQEARKNFAQSQGVEEAVERYWDEEGWNGTLPMSQEEFRQTLAKAGLNRKSIGEVFSQTISSAGTVAQHPSEKYKIQYKSGLDALLDDGPDLRDQDIVLKDSENWKSIKNYQAIESRLKIRYDAEFRNLLKKHGSSDIDGIAIKAKNNTRAWLNEEHSDWFRLSPSKIINKDGDEVAVANKDRRYGYFDQDQDLPTDKIKAMASLDDYPGVSYKDRVLGVKDNNYEPVVSDEVINSYFVNGVPQVQSFVDSSMGRSLQEATGLPASLIFAVHAEKLGKPLQDEEYIDLEEYNSLPEGVKRVLIHNSSHSGQVIQEAMNREHNNFSAAAKMGFTNMQYQLPVGGANYGQSAYIPPMGRLQGVGGSRHGISREEMAYAVNTIMGEAGPDDDKYYVLGVILNRKAANPHLHIRDIVAAPEQFVGYKEGREVDPQLLDHFMSDEGMAKTYQAQLHLGGRTQFRGRSLYHNMGEGDIRPNNRSNYYFYAPQAAGKHVKYNPAWHNYNWQSIWGGTLDRGQTRQRMRTWDNPYMGPGVEA